MNMQTSPDALHRIVKLALDSGEDVSIEDARRRFEGYCLDVRVGENVAHSPTLQAALLTVANCGRRCFLGGVGVSGALDVPLRVPWLGLRTLGEAVTNLGASRTHRSSASSASSPVVVVGDVPSPTDADIALRVTFDGWSGGVVPCGEGMRLSERHEFTPAGVLAGALAVSEAFQSVRGDALAGRRAAGLSLWEPGENWMGSNSNQPPLERLPSALWLLGLGHLGQAYLWTLGFLPYTAPEDVHLVLHDFDRLVSANDSTSILTNMEMMGEYKTRAMARWCEARGFRSSIIERPFSADFRLNDREPRLALCGVDNALARAAMEDVGFERVVEAGLGRGLDEYLTFQLHTFPAARSARARWGTSAPSDGAESLLSRPAYRALADGGLDRCGLLRLAGRAVGAPFVGAAVSALVIAEVLRMLVGGRRHELIDGTLRSPLRCNMVEREAEMPFNPGSTAVMR